MTRPRFSIVIPTRERARTLVHAMRSVLAQEFEDFELVVQDNCGSPATWEVVRGFDDRRIKYDRSETVLPMFANWERALSRCEGEYIFFLGDDDALMPDCTRLASEILAMEPLELLSWDKYTYWWDDCLEPVNRGRLFVHPTMGFAMRDTHALLTNFYDWKVGYAVLPSIYTGFVHRRVVEGVRALSGGRYFSTNTPDVWSGIVNCVVAKKAGHFERGLSLSGNSGRSTGCAFFFRSKGAARRAETFAEEGKTIEQLIHPALIPSIGLEVTMADQQYRAKEMFFPDDGRIKVNIPAVLSNMIGSLNRDPEAYDEALEDIRALAAKHSLDISRAKIPPKAEGVRPTPRQGPIVGPDGKLVMLAIHCAEAGVHDAHHAARLTAAVLPSISINPLPKV